MAAKPKAASGKMFLSLDRRKTSRADNDGNDGDDEDDHQPSKAPRAFLKDIAKAKSKTTQRAFVASIDTAVEDIVKNQPPDSVMSVCSQYSTVFGDGAANATAARSVKETILASQKNTPLFIQLCSALFSNKEGEKMTKPKLEKFLGITVSPFISSRAYVWPWHPRGSSEGEEDQCEQLRCRSHQVSHVFGTC